MNRIKVFLDILMTLLMILLMKIIVTGREFHELLGILIFILFMIHKGLNIKFIKAVGKNFFKGKLKFDIKVTFCFDIILLLFMIMNVFSGILISNYIFKSITVSNFTFVVTLHKFFAWWTLIFIAIHIGFHLERLVFSKLKKFELFGTKSAKIIFLMIYLVIVFGGVVSLSKYSIYSKIIPFANSSTQVESSCMLPLENKGQGNGFGRKKWGRNYKNRSNILDVVTIMLFFSMTTYQIHELAIKKKQ